MPQFTPTQIRDVYIERCKYPGFSNNLKRPTEARIRNACIDTYHKKNSFSDKWILRNFLAVAEEKDLIVALREDVGKFRPVVNFFKNITEDPRDETIDLIAWLIDFDNNGNEFQEPKKTGELPPEEESGKKLGNEVDLEDEASEDEASNNDVQTFPKHPKYSFKTQIIVTICVFTLVFGVGSFLFWQDKINRETITADEKCMYWNGDRYEAIACEKQINEVKVPLNMKRLNSLRKITAFDTLTESDLGRVWYAKIGQKNEFFTDGGMHPVDTAKRLKPLTPYILSKYVSYHRYILHQVLWGFGIAALVAIVLYLVSRFLNKRRIKVDLQPSI